MSPPAARPTRVRYAVMAFLCTLAFLSYLDRVCISRAQADIRHDLGLSMGQMGMVMGIFWLGYALFEIPGGWMGDRFGSRSTLSRIVLAWSLFTALSGAAVGFTSLIVYRLLFGIGEAGAFPNMARVQSRWLPAKSRARAGGFLWLCARWGGAFSFLLFGYLLDGFDSPGFRHAVARVPVLHFPASIPAWRLGFWTMGLVGLVWVALFYPWFRDNPRDKALVNDAELDLIQSGGAESETPRESHGGWRVWAALFSSGSLWSLALAYLCISFGWSFFVSWMPQYLEDAHHLSFKGSQAMDVLPLFCGGISCLLGGICSDALVHATGWTRSGRAVFPICGYLTAAAAMFAIRLTHTPGQAIALMCVASAANDFGQGACWATVIGIGGLYAGTAFGFMNMVGNVGNFLQPVVGAMVFKHAGWNALLAVYAGVYFAAACLWLFIDPRKPFYREPEPAAFPVVMRG
ncbi:MAG TPA: MFS transporter [Tepidisphaeraceae bacterium]